ncbi:hypothetical protein BC567DRAFT_238616 [Phyllosticta citribraziliensis]
MVLSYISSVLSRLSASTLAGIVSYDYPDKFPYYQWTNVENYIFAEYVWKLPIAMWSNDWTWLTSSDWPSLAKIDPEWEEVGSLLLDVCMPYDEYLRRHEAKCERGSWLVFWLAFGVSRVLALTVDAVPRLYDAAARNQKGR